MRGARRKSGSGARFELVSRESLLLANNVLLVVAVATVLLGTLYPLVLDALGMGKISVGPPYFDSVFVPLMAPVVFLMGVGPFARWKQAELPDLARRLRWALGLTVSAALPTGWAAGNISAAGRARLRDGVVDRVRRRHRPGRAPELGSGVGGSVWTRARQLPRAMLGMMLAHLGVAAFAFGVSMVKSYEVERDVRMDAGDTTEIAGYVFTFRGVRERRRVRTTAPRRAWSRSRATASR